MKQNPPAPVEPEIVPATEPAMETAAAADPILPLPTPAPVISEARLAANRANAQLSTGAKTAAGKAVCSHNAVKTALTGQTVLLPTDDVADYQTLGQQIIQQHQPATPEEERLVQSLIDSEWRLRRIPTLENGIYAIGREQLASSVPAHQLDTHVYLKYERNLKNIHLQEARVRRNREKDWKALTELQTARREKEAAAKKLAQRHAELRHQPQPPPQPATAHSAALGFEFETAPNNAVPPVSAGEEAA